MATTPDHSKVEDEQYKEIEKIWLQLSECERHELVTLVMSMAAEREALLPE